MNRIIAAFDGLKYKESTAEYAVSLCTDKANYLSGVFLDDSTYTSYRIYELVLEQGVSESRLHQLKHADDVMRHDAAGLFEKKCRESGVNYNIHHDKKAAVNELVHETIFSDVLVINRNENFVHHEEAYPSRFMRDLLSDTQCPVLLIPDKFVKPEKIIFLFDGENTSVYAFKMFNYLMSVYSDLPIEIVAVKNMGSDWHVPDHRLVKELVKKHYKEVLYTVLKGIPEVEIVSHLSKEKRNYVTILGAYRRTMVSRWFKSSMADALVNNFEQPLFIAHNK